MSYVVYDQSLSAKERNRLSKKKWYYELKQDPERYKEFLRVKNAQRRKRARKKLIALWEAETKKTTTQLQKEGASGI